MKRKTKKSKDIKIKEALEQLNKALSMDEPHIVIQLPWAPDKEDPEGVEFVKSIKTFMDGYKKYFKMKKINVAIRI